MAETEIVRRRIVVRGVVQGVGFRPFVYRAASALGLGGSVCNRGDAGVEIFVEGEPRLVGRFLDDVERRPPTLATVVGMTVEAVAPIGERVFSIAASREGGGAGGMIPPDAAICPACRDDLRRDTRYHDYWATSCTDCGPRFTVIEGLPYDRPLTSMRDFPLCPACEAEYRDPGDRRYHAEATACPACGPKLRFDGSDEDPIRRTAAALRAGEIVAIQGIGGTHMACDAANEGSAGRLRRRLGRPNQPFALMATEDMIPAFAHVEDAEWAELQSPERPVVVLRMREDALPGEIAPGLHTVGVMLPYSGLQVLLFERLISPLVMTSANLPGRPMWIDPGEIERRAAGIADHRLMHDRRIVSRCDDSVVRWSGGRRTFIRRSRGFTPRRLPIDLGEGTILALGPETGVTFALYAAGGLTLSQHIGSVDDVETYEFLKEAVAHLRRLTGSPEPDQVACDLHPRFLTTSLAREIAQSSGADIVRVQHHVAHFLSVMAEHDVDRAIGIVADGYGFGADGTAWGGEVFAAAAGRVERVGSLRPVRLPGGDLATRFPLRVAAGYLAEASVPIGQIEAELRRRGLDGEAAEACLIQLERGVNAPWTTSAGRFLDAVAAWLGVCRERTYEGEPAMRLEAAAAGARPLPLGVEILRDGTHSEIDLVSAFRALVEMEPHVSRERIAATAQWVLARGMAAAAVEAAHEHGVESICLSGGVAVNEAIVTGIRDEVESSGLALWTNEWVPCGDGGVSFGQAVAAGRRWTLSVADGPDAAAGERGEQGQ